MTSDPAIGAKLSKGGRIIHLPFWKNINASSEVLDETNGLTINKITAGADVACIHARGIMYGATDLAELVAGDDPIGAIAQMYIRDWNRDMQNILVATLEGAFSATSMAKSVKDISTETGDDGVINKNAIVDALYAIGDSVDELQGIMMHSAVMAKLVKDNMIQYLPDSEGKPTLPTYLNKTVIVDDALKPVEVTVGGAKKKAYPIYFFGAGAIAFNENNILAETETDRDIRTGEDYLASRRVFTMHPRGIKWVGNATGVTPSIAELKTGTNWELVEDAKNVHITKLLARVD